MNSKEKFENIFKSIKPNKYIKENVIIYGTGTLAKEVYDLMINKKYNINCFLNKNFDHPNVVKNILEVKRPNDISITDEMKNNITIIIAAFTSYADIHNIIEELRVLGYKDIVTFAELIDIFEDDVEGKFYLNTRKKFTEDKEKILEVAELWSDNKSKEVYESIVKFRLYKQYDDLILKDSLEEQYFPSDIKSIYNDKQIRFIDCGAFDGDTIEMLVNRHHNVDEIIAFEPDLKNYNMMLGKIEKLKYKTNKISAFPCAVYSSAAQMKFNMENSAGSNISNLGITTVQCISIDDSIGNFKPTFIKMDIEGSEYEALLGAKKTIYSEKPNLAISLYHTENDLYRIPLLINSWNVGYKFYVRMYGYSAYDVVLYAVT